MASDQSNHAEADPGSAKPRACTLHETATLPSTDENLRTTTVSADPPGFRLGEEIGRGGMGVVYRARDLELDREVAVKILQKRYEIGSPTAFRFIEEARITAQLQHPGIPAVYRVSTFADGRPFLAMKLVKGETLDVLQKAGGVDSLSVLEGVAQALGYAHSRKVIHRDLKPSNVMVGAFGEVQVMDWGLAKVLTDPPGSESTTHAEEVTAAPTVVKSLRESDGSFTQAGSVLGTPSYMSPEQAAGELEKVDERADVFGLGAIMCSLLTGRPPFEGKDAESVRLNAVRGNTDQALARLDSCGAEPEAVALCRRCLAFEPADRPRDANEVHAILARLRRDAEARARQAEIEAAKAEVEAAEQSQRRRTAAKWTAAVVGVLTLGIAGTTLGFFRADGARRFAEKQTEKANDALAEAKRQSDLATAVKEFLQNDLLRQADPEMERGNDDEEDKDDDRQVAADVRLRDVVLRAAKGIDGKFVEQPLVEWEIRLTIAQTLMGVGEYELALPHFQRLHELCEGAFGPDDRRSLAAIQDLGICLLECGRTREAEGWFRKAEEKHSRRFGADHVNSIRSTTALASAIEANGGAEEAMRLYEDALRRCRAAHGPDHPDTISCMINVATAYSRARRSKEALELREAVLAAARKTLGANDRHTRSSMNNLANSYKNLKRYSEALALFEEVLALETAKYGAGHPRLAPNLTGIASTLSLMGKHEEALVFIQQALDLRRKTLPENHPKTLLTNHNFAVAQTKVGRIDEALRTHEDVVKRSDAALGETHYDAIFRLNAYAIALSKAGRREEAIAAKSQVAERRKKALGEDHVDTLQALHSLAIEYANAGKYEEAAKVYGPLVERRTKTLGADHVDTLWSMHNLGFSLQRLERHAEALAVREQVLERRTRTLGADHPDTLIAAHNVAFSRSNLGRFAEAVELLKGVVERRTRVSGPDHVDTLGSMHNLGNALSELDRHSEALAVRETVLERRTKSLGLEHKDTLSAANNLAISRLNLRRFAEAEDLFRQTAERRTQVLGPDHAETLWSMHYLGNALSDLDRHAEALAVRETVLERRTKTLGPEHKDTLSAANNLAWSRFNLGRFAEAQELFRRTYEQRTNVLGPDHVNTWWCANGMVRSLVEQKQFAKAKPTSDRLVDAAATALKSKKSFDATLARWAFYTRGRIALAEGDFAFARKHAQWWESLAPSDRNAMVTAACLWSLTGQYESKRKAADSDRLAAEDGDKAMAWLKKAVAAGFNDRTYLEKDGDFADLRLRADFKKLVESLPKGPPAATRKSE